MKISKKILSLLLCAIMVLGSVAAGGSGFVEWLDAFSVKAEADYTVYAGGTCGTGLLWHLTDDGVITVSGTGAMVNGTSSTCPWSSYRSNVKSVVIENGVTSIGAYAFYKCTNLTDITFSESVTSVGDFAFSSCTALNRVNFTGTVSQWVSINFSDSYSNPVYYAKNLYIRDELLTNAVIEMVDSVNDYAFCNCTSLTDITISDSVTSIGSSAFYGCNALSKVNFTGTVNQWVSINFSGASSNPVIYAGNLYIGDELLRNAVLDDISCINDYAFNGCLSLVEITIPNSVTNIGESAFYGCGNLSKVNYTGAVNQWASISFFNMYSNPMFYAKSLYIDGKLLENAVIDGISSISVVAFYNCTSLTSVTISDSVTSIGEAAFYKCTGLKSVTFGNGLTSIGEDSFFGCTGLTSIDIPNNVESIGNSAFYGCTGLTSASIDARVVGANAFYLCSKLTSVSIGSGVTSIGNYAFWNCTKLTSIDIPNSVTSIGHNAFDGCSKLTNVSIGSGITDMGEDVFENTAFYSNSSNWNDGCFYISNILMAINSTSVDEFTIKPGTKVIGDDVFRDCASLTSINIPDSVISIGEYAFYGCSELTSVTIGCGVTSIGSSAFCGCGNLSKINYTGAVNQWASISFSNMYSNPVFYAKSLYIDGKLLENAVIDGVASINDSAFYNCISLTDITILDGVTSIGGYAFYGCTGLTSINISDSVTDIGRCAFYGCTGLINVTIPNKVTSVKYETFYGCTGLTSIDIPNCVTSIDGDAFRECTELTDVTIGNGVTSIGSYTFYNCKSLTSVTIGNAVTSIGAYAFYKCTNLTDITFSESVTSVGDSAFYDCNALSKVNYNGTVSQWVSISFLNMYSNPVFYAKSLYIDGKLLENAVIDGVDAIKDYAFYCCISLTDITILDGVTSIGVYAFYGCTGLTSVTIGCGVTSIGSSAFYGCSELTSVSIGRGVKSIGDWAFRNCTKLDEVNYTGTVSQWVSIKFIGMYSNPVYYAKKLYICDELLENAVIDGVASINDYAFYNCISLTDITILDGVTSIGVYAFYGCTGLTGIIIPNSTISIENSAFYGCTGLKELTIGKCMAFIGNSAFYGCTGLTEIFINAKCMFVFKSDSKVFYNAGISGDGVKVTFGDNVEHIPNFLFYNSSAKITDVTMQDSVTSVGHGAFYGCKSLTNMTISNSVTSIGGYAFDGCTGLTSVTIPDSVTNIEEYAFYGCTGLTSITILDSVTSIGDDAFYGCTGLTSIDIPDSVISIGKYAFYGCSELTNITLPKSLTSIGENAFSGCGSLIKFSVDAKNPSYSSDTDGVLYNKEKTILIMYPMGKTEESYTIAQGTKKIANYAFRNCRRLNNVKMPASLLEIGIGAFWGCTNLNINLPENIVSIGTNSFYSVKNQDIYLPKSLRWIGGTALPLSSSYTVTYEGSEEDRNNKLVINCTYTKSATWVYNCNNKNLDEYSSDGTTIALTKDSYFCCVNGLTVVYAVITLPEGADASAVTATWSVDDTDGVTVADAKTYSAYDNEFRVSAVVTGKQTGQYRLTVTTSNGAACSRSLTITPREGTVTGTYESYVEATILNGTDKYVDAVIVDGVSYPVQYGSLSIDLAESLKGKTVKLNLADGIVTEFNSVPAISDAFTNIDTNGYYGASYHNYDTENHTASTASVGRYADEFYSAMENYYSKFEAVGKENVGFVNVKKLAKQIQKKDEETSDRYITMQADTPDECMESIYYVLTLYLSNVVTDNVDIGDIDFSGELITADATVVNAIRSGMSHSGKFTDTYNGYTVTFNTANMWQAFAGSVNVTDKSGNSYTGAITPTGAGTQKVLNEFLSEMADVVKDAHKKALFSILSEFDSVVGISKCTDDELKSFLTDKINSIAKTKMGANILTTFRNIRVGYNTYKNIKEKFTLRELSEDDAKSILKDLNDISFSTEGIENKVLKDALASVETAKKNLKDDLYNYIYGIEPESTPTFKDTVLNFFGFKCPVEFEIYNANDELIGYVDSSDKHEQYVWHDDSIEIIVDGDAKYLYAPANKEINIHFVGLEDGTMNYTIERLENGIGTGRLNYYDVPLTAGGTYTQDIPADLNFETVSTAPALIGSTVITADEYISADNTNGHISVTGVCSEGGFVSGAGLYPIGELVKTIAVADDGYDFVGWYIGDTIVSTSNIYRFVAKNDVVVSAKFEESTNVNIYRAVNIAESTSGFAEIIDCGNEKMAIHFISDVIGTDNAVAVKVKVYDANGTLTDEDLVPLIDNLDGSFTTDEFVRNTDGTIELYDTTDTLILQVAAENRTVALISIVLDETEVTLDSAESTVLSCLPNPLNADLLEVIWSSSNENVATVDSQGQVTAVTKGSAVITATCGELESSCTVIVTEHIHSYTKEVTPATCTTQGYTTYTCTCGDTYQSDFVSSLGHSFTHYVYNNDATTEEDGTETAKCDNCDEIYTRVKEGSKLKTYIVTFMADAEKVEDVVYAEGATSIEEPTVPAKSGYKAEWESYVLNNTDFIVNAVYTPIKGLAVKDNSNIIIERGSADKVNSLEDVESYTDGCMWYIYGLEPQLKESDLLSDYITASGDCRIEVVHSHKTRVGTGSTITVIDNDTDEVIEKFYIIIYGDLNGDGSVNGSDYSICNDEAHTITCWSDEDDESYDPLKVKAANLDGRKNIKGTDASIINEAAHSVYDIDQVNGCKSK